MEPSFRQGDRMIVAITVRASEARTTPLVIADLLPAGFEIEGVLRPEDAGKTGPYSFLGDISVPNIAEARDDRFVAAIDLYEREPATVAYMVRAVTPGSFTMPGAVAEDMYRARHLRPHDIAHHHDRPKELMRPPRLPRDRRRT